MQPSTPLAARVSAAATSETMPQRVMRRAAEARTAVLAAGSYTMKKGGRFAWVAGVLAVVMVLPLLFEVGREVSTIEHEALIVADLKKKGWTDQQILQQGLTEGVDIQMQLSEA